MEARNVQVKFTSKSKENILYLLQTNDEICWQGFKYGMWETPTTLWKNPWRVYGLLIIFSVSGFPVIIAFDVRRTLRNLWGSCGRWDTCACQAWRFEIFGYLDARCSKSAPFWIIIKRAHEFQRNCGLTWWTQLFLCASNYTSCECKLLVRPCRLRGYLCVRVASVDIFGLFGKFIYFSQTSCDVS